MLNKGILMFVVLMSGPDVMVGYSAGASLTAAPQTNQWSRLIDGIIVRSLVTLVRFPISISPISCRAVAG